MFWSESNSKKYKTNTCKYLYIFNESYAKIQRGTAQKESNSENNKNKYMEASKRFLTNLMPKKKRRNDTKIDK